MIMFVVDGGENGQTQGEVVRLRGENGGDACWNGKERGRYEAPVVEASGLKATLKNPGENPYNV